MSDQYASPGISQESDPVEERYDGVASWISELSKAVDAPTGIKTVSQFEPEDIDFTDSTWSDRLLEVVSWLNFDHPIQAATHNQFVQSLSAALGINGDSQGVYEVEGQLALNELGLERLSERLELAVRLKDEFLEVLSSDGQTQSSATARWSEMWQ